MGPGVEIFDQKLETDVSDIKERLTDLEKKEATKPGWNAASGNTGAWGATAMTQPVHPFRPCGAEVGSVGVLPRALSDGLSSMSLIENAF